MKRSVLALTFVLAASPSFAQTAPAAADPHAGHAMEMQAPAAAQAPAPAPRNPNLPPTGDAPGDNKNAVALDQLKSSPRKSEWVDIKGSNGTPIKSFVVYPARRDKAPVVIVRKPTITTVPPIIASAATPNPIVAISRSNSVR